MKGMSDMSDCPMMNGSKPDSAPSRSVRHSGVTVNGSVVAIDKSQRNVTLRLVIPATGDAIKALSKVKIGEAVTATVLPGRDGQLQVSNLLVKSGDTVQLSITGIQCQACADRLQLSLKSVAGVKQVTVDAESSQATITYDPTKITVGSLKEAVQKTEPIHAGTPFGVKD
jgi:copper chaperone CopZ